MSNLDDFSSLKSKIDTQELQINDKKKKNIILPILFLVFGLLFIFSSGAYALQQILNQITPCSQTSTGICFQAVKTNNNLYKYVLKNLDSDKNYRLYIKRKVGDSTVDIGSTEINMKELNEKQENKKCFKRQESSDVASVSCCEGLEIKSDLSNDATWTQFTCCKNNECAEDGRCFASGMYSSIQKKCMNGVWTEPNSGVAIECKDTENSKNYNVKGTVTQGDFSISDQCSDDTSLLEVYCEENELKREMVECKCYDGHCWNDDDPVNPSNNSNENYCGDIGDVKSKFEYQGSQYKFVAKENNNPQNINYDFFTYKSDIIESLPLLDLFGPNSNYGCGGKVLSVWHYVESSSKWQRYVFADEAFPFLNDLTTIESGKVYDVKVTEDCIINFPETEMWKASYCLGECNDGVCDSNISSYCDSHDSKYMHRVSYLGQNIILQNKWNDLEGAGTGLILKSDKVNEISYSDLFGPDNPCSSAIESLWYYDWSSGDWYKHASNDPFGTNDLEIIKMNEPYIINIKEECRLSHPKINSFWISESCSDECSGGVCSVDRGFLPYCQNYIDQINNSKEHSYKVSYRGKKYYISKGWNHPPGAGTGLVYYDTGTKKEIPVLELFGPESQYGCAGKIQSVWWYDWTKGEFLSIDFTVPEFLWDLKTIKSGETYMIQASEKCTLEHPGYGSFWDSSVCVSGCDNNQCMIVSNESDTPPNTE